MLDKCISLEFTEHAIHNFKSLDVCILFDFHLSVFPVFWEYCTRSAPHIPSNTNFRSVVYSPTKPPQ